MQIDEKGDGMMDTTKTTDDPAKPKVSHEEQVNHYAHGGGSKAGTHTPPTGSKDYDGPASLPTSVTTQEMTRRNAELWATAGGAEIQE